MADKRDQWAESFSAEPQGGWLTGFVADEDKGTPRLMWRMGSWGLIAVGAVSVAVMAGQYEIHTRSDEMEAAQAIGRQERQLAQLTEQAQSENRRLVQAIDTLNKDRDRLFVRLTSVEKDLESATGSIFARQPLPSVPPAQPAPQIAAPATQAALVSSPITERQPIAAPPDFTPKPIDGRASDRASDKTSDKASFDGAVMAATEPVPAKPDDAAAEVLVAVAAPVTKPDVVQAIEPLPPVATVAIAPAPIEATAPVPRTEFGVDIGTANSIDGLRAIWRGLSRLPALSGLRPIIVLHERNSGLGMQLRLVAGPLVDAAAAARICAAMIESKRACVTSVFEGQRLALKNEVAPVVQSSTAVQPAPKPPRPAQKRAAPKPEPVPSPMPEQRSEQPPPRLVEDAPAEPPKQPATLSRLLGFGRQ
jgi:hypothetical protein